MHKLSPVYNQDYSGKVDKALGAECGGPWFKCRLVLGFFFWGGGGGLGVFWGIFCNFNK